MSITFYEAPFSSSTPVACALAELEVSHETVTFDLKKSDHKQPDFLKLNPNGTVPALVVDGAPVFEALAILLFLGDRYGVGRGLWPAFDSAKRLQALSWTTWAYATLAPANSRYTIASSERSPAELHSSVHADHAKRELERCLGVLEGQLKERPFLLGGHYSLVDLALANAVGYSVMCGLSADAFPSVSAWLATCMQRPAMRKKWS